MADHPEEWPHDEAIYLFEHYGVDTVEAIAKALRKSKNAVIGKASRLGLKSGRARGAQGDALTKLVRRRFGAVPLPQPSPAPVRSKSLPPETGYVRVAVSDVPTTDRTRFCLHPHGTPGEKGFHYCSLPPLMGRDRCPRHADE